MEVKLCSSSPSTGVLRSPLLGCDAKDSRLFLGENIMKFMYKWRCWMDSGFFLEHSAYFRIFGWENMGTFLGSSTVSSIFNGKWWEHYPTHTHTYTHFSNFDGNTWKNPGIFAGHQSFFSQQFKCSSEWGTSHWNFWKDCRSPDSLFSMRTSNKNVRT